MRVRPAYYYSTALYTLIGLLGFYFFLLGLYQGKYLFGVMMLSICYVAFDNTFCQTRKRHYVLTKKRF